MSLVSRIRGALCEREREREDERARVRSSPIRSAAITHPARLPCTGASDEGFTEKLCSVFRERTSLFKAPKFGRTSFTLVHFAAEVTCELPQNVLFVCLFVVVFPHVGRRRVNFCC